MTKVFLNNEQETLSLGALFAANVAEPVIIFLEGNLGAGKTTFVRGFLQALGVRQRIKSPTYTLVEPYQTEKHLVYHFDLYRLSDPEELEYMGARDYFDNGICLIEWPEKGEGYLPTPDIDCHIMTKASGREWKIKAFTERGERLLSQVQTHTRRDGDITSPDKQ